MESATIYHSNCTVPDARVGYFSSPPVRGTLDILWSSLGILILCTWSIQHLNVPIQTQPNTRRQKLWRKTYSFLKKLKWMLVTLFAPEYILGKALADRWSALHYQKRMKEFPDKIEWTLSHSFFANMGGFVVRFPENLPGRSIHGVDRTYQDHAAIEGDHVVRVLSVVIEQDSRRSADSTPVSPTQIVSEGIQLQTFAEMAAPVAPARRLTEIALASGTGSIPRQPERVQSEPVAAQFNKVKARTKSSMADHFATHVSYLLDASPSDIENQFNKWQGEPRFNLDGLEKANQRDRDSLGEMTWKVHPHNHEIAEKIQQGGNLGVVSDAELQAFFMNVTSLQGNEWILDVAQLRLARELGILQALPRTSRDEIDDKNKGDFLVKTLAIIQISWLCAQLLTRAIRNLPTSQLEIVALAFATCSLITFALLWEKPQDAQAAIYVDAARLPSIDEVKSIARIGPVNILGLTKCRNWMSNNVVHDNGPKTSPMFMFTAGNMAGAAIFGALHCLAWNTPFPTSVERKMWRAASIVATCAPVVGVLVHWVFRKSLKSLAKHQDLKVNDEDNKKRREAKRKRKDNIRNIQKWCSVLGISLFGGLYILARLYITVEIFRALCFLPPRAFYTTWATNMPHIN